MARSVSLQELAGQVGGRVVGQGTVEVRDVTHDSRQAGPGTLFVAVRGFRLDGHDYVSDAEAAGAAALCVETTQAVTVPQLVVADSRKALARLAASVHDHPSRSLNVVGVTGTNGKTTITHLLESIAEAAGRRSAVVGTVGARIAGRPLVLSRTTPEASDLQRLLAEMVRQGVELAFVEVSSHALALNRVDATWFSVAAFTNLTQDHLDFHGDMDAYFGAKASLFDPSRSGRAVVWVDDPYGARLAQSVRQPLTRVAVSSAADVWGESIVLNTGGSAFTLATPEARSRVDLPLVGSFNVENALVAAACALSAGLPLDAVSRGLSTAPQVPGRFERVDLGQPFGVFVDYAHTPQGVEVVVKAGGAIAQRRVITVIGAGGDRDQAKRPMMGAAAAVSDLVVVTSDNPRSEDPLAIMADVVRGARGGTAEVVEEPDRRSAIRIAVASARPGDVVLVLGKGHEQGQELAEGTVPFDDRVVTAEEIRARGVTR